LDNIVPNKQGHLPAGAHFGFLDLLKAIASNLIVLHHLALYGPMSDHARPLAPWLIDWLDEHGRIAVQVFLVIGGFLAAKSLSPHGMPGIAHPGHAILRRFLKLVLPFTAAIALVIAASELARLWMTHDSISATPTLGQILAHVFLLHSLLDVESLSAGAWYVAIDFQLYVLFALLLWTAAPFAGERAPGWLVPALVAAVAAVSLLYFNRDAGWDVWALYFAGSYGMGALAWWAANARRDARVALLFAVIFALGTAALLLEFRSRIALALLTSLALAIMYRTGTQAWQRMPGAIGFLGRISYSVFLVHFPIILVVNAAFTRFVPPIPHAQAAGMLLAWVASIVVGAVFHRWVEVPLGRLSLIGSPVRNRTRAAE
jgi:peptidoglycan/LPS O-acetylase OafA/YrhL